MEWLTAMNSQSNGPSFCRFPSWTSMVLGVIRCYLSLALMKARVSFEPTRGMSGRSRNK